MTERFIMTEIKKNFCLDEIVSIEEFGKCQTYDFTIPETHCFFANDVLVHNSGVLEEHPDVVFLLHASLDTLKERIKKYFFFVAKNRNGRIGTVPIRYDGKYYRFTDDNTISPPANYRKDIDDEETVYKNEETSHSNKQVAEVFAGEEE